MDLKSIFGLQPPPAENPYTLSAQEQKLRSEAIQQKIDMLQGQYANQVNQMIGTLSNAAIGAAQDYPQKAPRYRTMFLRVEEISNGFILDYQGDRYHCPDMKAVGDRVIACMVAAELKK